MLLVQTVTYYKKKPKRTYILLLHILYDIIELNHTQSLSSYHCGFHIIKSICNKYQWFYCIHYDMLPARHHHYHHHQHKTGKKNLSLNLHYDFVCMFVCVRVRHMAAKISMKSLAKSHYGNKKNRIIGEWVSQWNRFMIFFCHFGATMIFYVNVCTVFLQHQRQQRLQQRRRWQRQWWWWRRDQLQCENEIIKLPEHHHNRITHGVFAHLSALLPLSLIKSYLIFWYPLSCSHKT